MSQTESYHNDPGIPVAPPGCPVHQSWDPFDDDYVADPFLIASKLRDDHPVFYAKELGHVVVTRMHDIAEVFTNPDTYASSNVQDPLYAIDDRAGAILGTEDFNPVAVMSNRAEPDHRRIRVHTRQGFSRRRLRTLEDYMSEGASELVCKMLSSGEGNRADFYQDFAFPLPAEIVFRFIGFPQSDDAKIKDWCVNRLAFSWGRPSPDEQVDIAENMLAYWRYCREFTASKRDNRSDDFASELLDAHDKDPQDLSYREVESIIYGLSFAGHDPVTNLMCNTLLCLLPRRDQWDAICEDPSLIPQAIEETLRYESSQIGWRRITTEDTTLGGFDIPANTRIFLNLAAAHRDPEIFGDPHTFNIFREDANQHIAFGKGIHYCLGAGLAKTETRIMLETLSQRIPRVRLVQDQEFHYFPNITFRGPDKLEIEWDTPTTPEAQS